MANFPADDLNDPLDDLIGSAPRTEAKPLPASFKPATERMLTEACPKCRGAGMWRPGYPCFKCKGTGQLSFKTSFADRQRSRAGAVARKARSAADNLAAFVAEHADVWAWMNGNTFGLAVDMKAKIEKWGSLSDRQLEVCRSAMAKLAAKRVEAEARKAAAPTINSIALEEAFAKAEAVSKKPRLIVAGLKINRAKPTSANAGALYVKRAGEYLGKVMGGRFHRAYACDDATQTIVLGILADPKGAAIAHGRATGSCACCGRELTDPASIAAGIGPICASKFGW